MKNISAQKKLPSTGSASEQASCWRASICNDKQRRPTDFVIPCRSVAPKKHDCGEKSLLPVCDEEPPDQAERTSVIFYQHYQSQKLIWGWLWFTRMMSLPNAAPTSQRLKEGTRRGMKNFTSETQAYPSLSDRINYGCYLRDYQYSGLSAKNLAEFWKAITTATWKWYIIWIKSQEASIVKSFIWKYSVTNYMTNLLALRWTRRKAVCTNKENYLKYLWLKTEKRKNKQ